MATLTKGTTFASGDVITPAKLNNLVDAATVSNIVNTDISASAAISLSKLATGALPAGITIASANIVDGAIATADIADSAITSNKVADSAITSAKIADGTIVNADISALAAISHNKLANISSGQVLLGNASNIPTATALSGDVTINSSGVTVIGSGIIDNAKINASAGIVDSKLATISTAGKVANSATTATSANTVNAIVARDASGNFSAGTITAGLSGNATTATSAATCTGNSSTATTWQTARNLALTGEVTATLSSVNGSANVSATATISNNSITTAKIADANVTTAKIADANVTTEKIADANVTTAKLADGSVTQSKLNSSVTLVPTGAIMPFAMNSAPSGWLAADGSAINRSVYATLFSAIGTTYGTGDGSTTFNLPDLRGIFVRGAGSQTISGITYNKTFGAKETDAMQGHIHSFNGAPWYSGSNSNGGAGPVSTGSGNPIGNPSSDGTNGIPRTASETRPANIALLYCIKF